MESEGKEPVPVLAGSPLFGGIPKWLRDRRRQSPFFLPGLLMPVKVLLGLSSHSQETSTVLPPLQLHPTISQTRDRCHHVGSSRYNFWAEGFACDLQKLSLKQAPPSHTLPTLSDGQALPSVGPQDLCSPSPLSKLDKQAAKRLLLINRQSLDF